MQSNLNFKKKAQKKPSQKSARLSGGKRFDRQAADLPSAEQPTDSDWLTRPLSSCKTSQRKYLVERLGGAGEEGIISHPKAVEPSVWSSEQQTRLKTSPWKCRVDFRQPGCGRKHLIATTRLTRGFWSFPFFLSQTQLWFSVLGKKEKEKEEQEPCNRQWEQNRRLVVFSQLQEGRTLQYGRSLIFDKRCDIYGVRLKDGGQRWINDETRLHWRRVTNIHDCKGAEALSADLKSDLSAQLKLKKKPKKPCGLTPRYFLESLPFNSRSRELRSYWTASTHNKFSSRKVFSTIEKKW